MTSGVGWSIDSKQKADALHQHILQRLSEGRHTFLSEQEGTRTLDQNSALHALLRRLAGDMNDAGYDVKTFLAETKSTLELPWTEKSCKELLVRPVIKAMYTKQSTTQLTKQELSEAIDVLLARVAEITGVTPAGLEGDWHG